MEDYSIEKYLITVEYKNTVRIKADGFIKLIDVYIEEGKKSRTTLHFDDIRNPQVFTSKPFITELEKLEEAFSNNDAYALKRFDLVDSISSITFTTYKATEKMPDVITYSFVTPTLIDVKHENGEFILVYEWEIYGVIDLTSKFFNAQLEDKYKKKAKKDIQYEMTTNDIE